MTRPGGEQSGFRRHASAVRGPLRALTAAECESDWLDGRARDRFAAAECAGSGALPDGQQLAAAFTARYASSCRTRSTSSGSSCGLAGRGSRARDFSTESRPATIRNSAIASGADASSASRCAMNWSKTASSDICLCQLIPFDQPQEHISGPSKRVTDW